SCGIPDISYHGENAWQISSEVSSRQLGIFYHGDGEEESCYVAYNMHWTPHLFALPKLPNGKHWYLAASTDDGVLEDAVPIEKVKCVEVEERTIKVFVVR
ncbi:MAG: glycogen debranching protein, partial [Bariatricus sp.]